MEKEVRNKNKVKVVEDGWLGNRHIIFEDKNGQECYAEKVFSFEINNIVTPYGSIKRYLISFKNQKNGLLASKGITKEVYEEIFALLKDWIR